MTNRFLIFFLLLISATAFSQSEDDNIISSQFIVMLKPVQDIAQLVKEQPSLQIKKCLSKRMNIWLLENTSSFNAEKLLQLIEGNKIVKLAQFNHRVQQRSLIPNDLYFSSQWNMLNTGQGGGTVGADIDAPNAWAINHGNVTANGDSIVIAIIDGSTEGGFDITNEDLNFFVNANEIPNNGIDDDGNGFIDDYFGWNALTSNGVINPGGNADPHAMHVSGIAAAIGNNATGVAGVCWGAKILRVVGTSNTEAQVVEAYDYVREMRILYDNTNGEKGAYVVVSNTSFGIDGGPHSAYPVWCAMYDSMGIVGILSAAATSNQSGNIDVNDDMPTGCPSKYLIAVTNTTDQDKLNAAWGDTSIDIGAPGTGIYSTENSNTYGIMTGTSMASPHVAGTVAAMYAAACTGLLNEYAVHPDSVALTVKQMILSGATRISALYNKSVSGGRLNLYNAINNLNEYNCDGCNYVVSVTATQPLCSNTCNGLLQLSVPDTGAYSYTWNTGDTGVTSLNNLCPGNYSVTVTNRASGCSQIKNGYLYKPDSIVVSSIHIIPPVSGDSGNIIVTASAGNYVLSYSLDSVHYQQASTLVISNNGNYTVYIENNIGCVVERNVIVSGIDDVIQNTAWSLFPNPANSQLNVSLSLAKSTEVTFSFSNILGQEVLLDKQIIAAGLCTVNKDISELSAGSYFLTLRAGNSTSTRMFVITR